MTDSNGLLTLQIRTASLKKSSSKLPPEVIALEQKINDFMAGNMATRSRSEWHNTCMSSRAFLAWRKRGLVGKLIQDVGFSMVAARSYIGLFEFANHDITHCSPSEVAKAASLAKELKSLLPHKSLLPDDIKESDFFNQLIALSEWRYKDILPDPSERGDNLKRWLIYKIAEEFCYSFVNPPPVSIIGDIVRLGWLRTDDRSILNTATEELLSKAFEAANARRNNTNKSETISKQAIFSAASKANELSNNQQETAKPATVQDNPPTPTNPIDEIAKLLAKTVDDPVLIRRIVSLIQAHIDEKEYPIDY